MFPADLLNAFVEELPYFVGCMFPVYLLNPFAGAHRKNFATVGHTVVDVASKLPNQASQNALLVATPPGILMPHNDGRIKMFLSNDVFVHVRILAPL